MSVRSNSGTTSNNAGHTHQYQVDSSGNGWAYEAYHPEQSEIHHKHKIVNWVVQSAQSECYPHCKNIYGIEGAPPHIHSLSYKKGGITKNTVKKYVNRNSKRLKKYNPGGMLIGPSHEQGGIPAIVAGQDPIELEGGEYIINAQTVNAVGQPFLDELNSTETTYHTGGYDAGELPDPSYFKDGGRVKNNRRNNMRKPTRRTSPKPTSRRNNRRFQTGGGMNGNGRTNTSRSNNQNKIPCTGNDHPGGGCGEHRPRRRVRQGGRMAVGGNTCPSGTNYMNGTCVPITTPTKGGGYRKGGRIRRKNVSPKRMQHGGRVPNIMQRGGSTTSTAHNHSHGLNVDGASGDGRTTGGDHTHLVRNGIIQTYCDSNGNCHGHS